MKFFNHFFNHTAFNIAVKKGNIDIVKLLLDQQDIDIFIKSVFLNVI